MITAISGPGIAAGDLARRKHDQDDPGRHCHVCPIYVRERAHRVQEPGRGLFARRGYPEHVRELAGSHLDTDASEEPDQHGAGKEIRQEPEPGQPGKQQHRPGQQGREPGQPDVSLRPGHRETGKRGGEYDGGSGIRGHHEVTRRTEDANTAIGSSIVYRPVTTGIPAIFAYPRTSGMPRAASVMPASTSAGTWDRSIGSSPRIAGSARSHPRWRPPREPGNVSPPPVPCGFGFVHHPAARRFVRSQQPADPARRPPP